MCGRYVVFTSEEYQEIQSIIDEISEEYNSASMANGEVYPTNLAPAIYQENGKRILTPMKWSYGEFSGRTTINARAETIIEKPMFRQSFHQRRCLIPANAYYEWKQEEGQKKKMKYEISIQNIPLFFMAGIYNTFKDKGGNLYTGYAIITTEASHTTSHIHNRMPVILSKGKEEMWLGDRENDIRILTDILKPYQDNVVFKAIS